MGCSVTGLMGKYKCPVTGDYLATLEAYGTHRETRLKGTPLRAALRGHIRVMSACVGASPSLALTAVLM